MNIMHGRGDWIVGVLRWCMCRNIVDYMNYAHDIDWYYHGFQINATLNMTYLP